MTVLVFDGQTLAADTLACSTGGRRRYMSKIGRASNGDLMAGEGGAVGVCQLLAWYAAGGEPKAFPADVQKPDDWAGLWVIKKDSGQVLYFEKGPTPIPWHDKTFASGSGGPFASAALSMGADAFHAVQVAMEHQCDCGGKVEFLELNP
jgi:hypothetical protein